MINGAGAADMPAGRSGADDRSRMAAEIAIALLIAAIIGAVNIWRSMHTGRLSAPPAYDDVVYLTSARQWIADLGFVPFGASVHALFDQHAPLWTWVAIIGFSASGGLEAGPYAAATALLVGYFYGILAMMRPLPFAIAWGCVIAIAMLPFLNHVATEFRPDLIHGAYLGLCAVCVLRRPFLGRRRREQFGLGLLAGLLLVAKPAACLPTIALLGAALAMRLALDVRYDGLTRRAALLAGARASLWFSFGAILVASPTFAIRYAQIIAYIYSTLVANREVWRFDATFSEHLLFYLVGGGGAFALGAALWVGLATFGLRLAASLFSRDRADAWVCAATAALVTFAYAMPTITIVKTYFLGSVFYGTLVAASVSNLVAVGRVCVLPPRFARARGWILLTAAVLIAGWPGYRLYRHPFGLATVFQPEDSQNYRVSTARIWGVVESLAQARAGSGANPRPLRVLFNSPVPASPTVIAYYASAQRQQIVTGSVFLEADVERAMSAMSRWDVVVLSSAIAHPLPGPRMGDVLIDRLNQRDDFALVDSFAQTTRGVVRIYARRVP